jgi:acetyl/propionyl-CoA carboxylase alpha subunit
LRKQSILDAIHPGYGFLSESAEFAKAVEDAGILFIGPKSSVIALLGDKGLQTFSEKKKLCVCLKKKHFFETVSARKLAKASDIPTLVGSDEAVSSVDEGFFYYCVGEI